MSTLPAEVALVHEPTDAALLAAAHDGDVRASAALLTRHADRVVRFAHSLCDNAADADDAAQDALIAAYHGIGSVRSAAALSSWLFAVTRSFCVKQRRRIRAGRVPLDDGPPMPSPDPGPEADASGHELAGGLTQALRALAPKYREVVWLRDVEGLTAPEVAEALELDVAAVKTRLHRGRAQLRARVAPVLATPGTGPACPDIVERFSSFLEGDIGHEQCVALRAHVDDCASCNAACEALKRTVSLCNGARVPFDVQDRVKKALAIAIGPA